MDQSYRPRKLKSTKKHKSSHLAPSNNHLILNLLTAAMCILVCSNHFSLPWSSLEPYMNHFLSITLPHMKSTFLHPKCLFIVVNAILVFLIGEWRLRASPSSPADDLYAEYINRINRGNKGFKVHGAVPKKKHDKGRDSKKDSIKEDRRVAEVGAEGTRKLVQKDKDEKELPAEELNRRVEAFIARVNKRRSLEGTSLICADA